MADAADPAGGRRAIRARPSPPRRAAQRDAGGRYQVEAELALARGLTRWADEVGRARDDAAERARGPRAEGCRRGSPRRRRGRSAAARASPRGLARRLARRCEREGSGTARGRRAERATASSRLRCCGGRAETGLGAMTPIMLDLALQARAGDHHARGGDTLARVGCPHAAECRRSARFRVPAATAPIRWAARPPSTCAARTTLSPREARRRSPTSSAPSDAAERELLDEAPGVPSALRPSSFGIGSNDLTLELSVRAPRVLRSRPLSRFSLSLPRFGGSWDEGACSSGLARSLGVFL